MRESKFTIVAYARGRGVVYHGAENSDTSPALRGDNTEGGRLVLLWHGAGDPEYSGVSVPKNGRLEISAI